MSAPSDNDWMTKRELSRTLQVSPRTIERLRIPCTRVGGQNRYFMSEVERFLCGCGQEHDNVVPLRRPQNGEAA